MKKLFVSAFLLIAIASFGGIIAWAPAHAADAATAASLTPAQTATLQQSINAMKERVMELQAEAALQAKSGSAVTVAITPASSPIKLSASDAASINMALTSLANLLMSMKQELSSNSQLAAGNQGAVLMALKGIGTTLTGITAAIVNGNGGSEITMTSGSSASGSSAAPSANTPGNISGTAVTPTAPSTASAVGGTPVAETAPSTAEVQVPNAAPGTAQISTAWYKNLNWPLTAVIVIVLAIVALWLFWPGEGEPEKNSKKITVNVSPVSAAPTTAAAPIKIASEAVSAPAVASSAPMPMKAMPTVPQQPQQQQRKPA